MAAPNDQEDPPPCNVDRQGLLPRGAEEEELDGERPGRHDATSQDPGTGDNRRPTSRQTEWHRGIHRFAGERISTRSNPHSVTDLIPESTKVIKVRMGDDDEIDDAGIDAEDRHIVEERGLPVSSPAETEVEQDRRRICSDEIGEARLRVQILTRGIPVHEWEHREGTNRARLQPHPIITRIPARVILTCHATTAEQVADV
jgi:hypothetical protein